MRYKDKDALVAGLRDAADFIEKNGAKLPFTEYDTECNVTHWIHGSDKNPARKQLKEIAKVLGKSEKVHSGDWFDLKKSFGPFSLKFSANRNIVCEAKVVGQKTIPAREATPERVVDEIEYICTEPLLAG